MTQLPPEPGEVGSPEHGIEGDPEPLPADDQAAGDAENEGDADGEGN